MKKFVSLLFIPTLLLSSCGEPPIDEYKHLIKPGKVNVILITGQSNATGVAPTSYLKIKDPQSYLKFENGINNVLTSYWVADKSFNYYFEPTRFGMSVQNDIFGPEIGIADIYSQANGFTYIIKFAPPGTTLDNMWLNSRYERGRLYNDSIDWIKKKFDYLKSLGAEPNIIGQFWMQGEGDSSDGLWEKYETNQRNLINFYREDLKDFYDKTYPFVDAYISTKTMWPKPKEINEAKQRVADSDPNVFCIKTNGEDETSINLNIKSQSGEGDDSAHYDSESQLLLGRTVARIIQENQ